MAFIQELTETCYVFFSVSPQGLGDIILLVRSVYSSHPFQQVTFLLVSKRTLA